jgi:hypothetical protein
MKSPVTVALIAVLALVAGPAGGAQALVISPLSGMRDASPQTQISFLGAAANEIASISVVGSQSGPHEGHLASYVSAAGASFLPVHPFIQGERVAVSAVVGHRRVGSTFTVARLAAYSPTPLTSGPSAKPGAVQSFVSEPTLKPPSMQVLAASPAASPGDIFLTSTHGQSGPMIVDDGGRLVWFHPVPKGEQAMDLQLERYEGKPVLVWWEGHIASIGVGFGTDEIVGSDYRPIARVSGGNGYQADLHDIQITSQGSAFITAYSLVRADLSSAGGARDGTLIDAIVQEVDIKTGLVMFEWHAYGHVSLVDSHSSPTSSAQPWDYFHINSISLDPWGDGNFLISARNTWAGYEVDAQNGSVLWRLGGRRSTFKMDSGTGTAWQHDIRWQPDYTLTSFDDGAAPKVHSQSRAIREHIDWKHLTAHLVGRDIHAPGILSGSQGNDQLLPGGGSFVGWGEQPYFTEFSPSGQILFDARMAYPGESYRAYRFPWSATPASTPVAKVISSGASATVYASWNGATAVSAWAVLGGASATAMAPLASATSSGFETAITVGGADRYYEVQALDGSGQVLSTSPLTPR